MGGESDGIVNVKNSLSYELWNGEQRGMVLSASRVHCLISHKSGRMTFSA